MPNVHQNCYAAQDHHFKRGCCPCPIKDGGDISLESMVSLASAEFDLDTNSTLNLLSELSNVETLRLDLQCAEFKKTEMMMGPNSTGIETGSGITTDVDRQTYSTAWFNGNKVPLHASSLGKLFSLIKREEASSSLLACQCMHLTEHNVISLTRQIKVWRAP